MAKRAKRKGRTHKHPRRGRPSGESRWDAGAAVIVGLWLVCWAAFAGLDTYSPLGQRVAGVDPVGYYVWFRSLAFDGDLQFENEYRAFNPGGIPGDTLVDPDGPRTPTGHLQNAFSLGPALMWSPFLLGAHAVAAVGSAPADGFSQPYHAAVFLANAFYGLAGTLLIYYSLRAWFRAAVSATAAVAVWAASPLLYYTYGQEAMSHTPSFCAMALLLLVWARLRLREGYWPWVAVGAALGLATLVRWQNVTFALIPAVDLLARDWRRNFPRLAACGAATVLVFLPQMVAWRVLYGSFLTIPQGGGFMDWTHPHLLRLLFSAEYGLITWTPLMALGVAGLFVWPREDRLPYIVLAVAFLVQLYVQAAAGNVGWSYGMRRMDNCMPLLAVGIALLLSRTPLRPRYMACALAPFVLWNSLFVLQYGGFINRQMVQRSLEQFAEERHTTPAAMLRAGRLPDGQPFDVRGFVYAHTFPKGGGPTFQQFVPDKLLVLEQIGRRLTGSE